MKVKLFDYRNRWKEFEIGDLDDILVATLDIFSGDETLTVVYKNGKTAFFDSSDDRITSFEDGSYVVYVDGANNTMISERFINRETTWDMVTLHDKQ